MSKKSFMAALGAAMTEAGRGVISVAEMKRSENAELLQRDIQLRTMKLAELASDRKLIHDEWERKHTEERDIETDFMNEQALISNYVTEKLAEKVGLQNIKQSKEYIDSSKYQRSDKFFEQKIDLLKVENRLKYDSDKAVQMLRFIHNIGYINEASRGKIFEDAWENYYKMTATGAKGTEPDLTILDSLLQMTSMASDSSVPTEDLSDSVKSIRNVFNQIQRYERGLNQGTSKLIGSEIPKHATATTTGMALSPEDGEAAVPGDEEAGITDIPKLPPTPQENIQKDPDALPAVPEDPSTDRNARSQRIQDQLTEGQGQSDIAIAGGPDDSPRVAGRIPPPVAPGGEPVDPTTGEPIDITETKSQENLGKELAKWFGGSIETRNMSVAGEDYDTESLELVGGSSVGERNKIPGLQGGSSNSSTSRAFLEELVDLGIASEMSIAKDVEDKFRRWDMLSVDEQEKWAAQINTSRFTIGIYSGLWNNPINKFLLGFRDQPIAIDPTQINTAAKLLELYKATPSAKPGDFPTDHLIQALNDEVDFGNVDEKAIKAGQRKRYRERLLTPTGTEG